MKLSSVLPYSFWNSCLICTMSTSQRVTIIRTRLLSSVPAPCGHHARLVITTQTIQQILQLTLWMTSKIVAYLHAVMQACGKVAGLVSHHGNCRQKKTSKLRSQYIFFILIAICEESTTTRVPIACMPSRRLPDSSPSMLCSTDEPDTFWYSSKTARSCGKLCEHKIRLNTDSSVPQRALPAWNMACHTQAHHDDITRVKQDNVT